MRVIVLFESLIGWSLHFYRGKQEAFYAAFNHAASCLSVAFVLSVGYQRVNPIPPLRILLLPTWNSRHEKIIFIYAKVHILSENCAKKGSYISSFVFVVFICNGGSWNIFLHGEWLSRSCPHSIIRKPFQPKVATVLTLWLRGKTARL